MQVRVLIALACLGAPAEADTCRPKSGSETAELAGTRVVVCYGDRTCMALDLGTLAWKPAKHPASGAEVASSAIKSSTIVTACAPDGSACHTVTTPPALGLEVVTDGPLVAVIEDEQITVAGVSTGKVEATIAPWQHPMSQARWSFRDVRFVAPDRLFAELGDGRTTLARIVTARTGAAALEFPGPVDRTSAVWLGNELALASEGSTELVLADVKRLVHRAIPLFPEQAPLSLLAATPKAIVAVQFGGDGTVAIVDGKSATLVPGPPVCP